MTDAALYKICRKWQKILRLEDWDITIGFRQSVDMISERCYACVSQFEEKRQASIEVLNPDDFRANDFRLTQDIETSVVHELLHIYTRRMMPKNPKSHQETAEEQMIHALSKALVFLDQQEA